MDFLEIVIVGGSGFFGWFALLQYFLMLMRSYGYAV